MHGGVNRFGSLPLRFRRFGSRKTFSLYCKTNIQHCLQGHREGGTRGTCPPLKLPRWKFFCPNSIWNLWHSIKFSAYCLYFEVFAPDPTGDSVPVWTPLVTEPTFCPLPNKLLAAPLLPFNVSISYLSVCLSLFCNFKPYRQYCNYNLTINLQFYVHCMHLLLL